jgi:two-component system, NarL family, response regulator NreC
MNGDVVRGFPHRFSMFHGTSSSVPGATFSLVPAHLHLASARDGDVPTEAAPTTVVLVEGHAVLRRTLRCLLDVEGDVAVVAEASDLATGAQDVRAQVPQVLVVDLGRPTDTTIETIEAIEQLRAQVPRTEIVVLTMQESPLCALQTLDAGALGFVLKDRADCELLDAIRRAARGEEFVSARVAAGLDALRRAVDGDNLSPREVEIVRLIALGHTSAEIAAKLHRSRRTVETHRARIFSKLGLKTRAELVQFALRRHLLWGG